MALADDGKSLLLSFRHIGLAKIDKESNKILWICSKNYNTLNLNGLIEQQNLFTHQHDIRFITDTKFSVFNNNIQQASFKNAQNKKSQVCEIDIIDNKVESYQILETEQPASYAMGGAIKIKDNTYDICYGFSRAQFVIEEFNFDSKISNMRFKFTNNDAVYRVERANPQ